jgi:hypothetical protein
MANTAESSELALVEQDGRRLVDGVSATFELTALGFELVLVQPL